MGLPSWEKRRGGHERKTANDDNNNEYFFLSSFHSSDKLNFWSWGSLGTIFRLTRTTFYSVNDDYVDGWLCCGMNFTLYMLGCDEHELTLLLRKLFLCVKWNEMFFEGASSSFGPMLQITLHLDTTVYIKY